MSEQNTVEWLLTLETEQVEHSVSRLRAVIYRTLYLLRRLGLPEPIDEAIQKVMRLIMTLRQAQLAMHAFQAAAGPIGWAWFAVTATTAVFISVDAMAEVSSR